LIFYSKVTGPEKNVRGVMTRTAIRSGPFKTRPEAKAYGEAIATRHPGAIVTVQTFSNVNSKTGKSLVIKKRHKKAPRKNPAKKSPGTLIGKQLKQINTTNGVCKPQGRASVWGLKDGGVLFKGFFPKVPNGTVKTVDYFHTAKAKREGLKNPQRPWRHSYTKERPRLTKTRGGVLMKAGKTPLWAKR